MHRKMTRFAFALGRRKLGLAASRAKRELRAALPRQGPTGKKGPAVDGIGEKGRVHRLKLVSARLSTARATGVQSVSVVVL